MTREAVKTAGKRRGRRCCRGQALIELALAAPILLFLAMGAVDFSSAYKTKIDAENQAEAAARQAATTGTISAAAGTNCQFNPTPAPSPLPTPSTSPQHTTVTITVTCTYEPITPLIKQAFGAITTRSVVVARTGF